MTVMLAGPFKKIAEIRNSIQGEKEPYLYGCVGGFTVTGLQDDIGGGEAALILSPVQFKGDDGKKAEQQRQVFLNAVKTSCPSVRIL